MRAALLGLGLALGACLGGDHAPALDRLACDRCHATQYDEAPLHLERGYDRACHACHGTADFAEAEASHDAFSITSDEHAGFDCADCHLSRTDREAIACTGCHAHTAGRTDPRHLGNGDYAYEPAACLRCHRGEDD